MSLGPNTAPGKSETSHPRHWHIGNNNKKSLLPSSNSHYFALQTFKHFSHLGSPSWGPKPTARMNHPVSTWALKSLGFLVSRRVTHTWILSKTRALESAARLWSAVSQGLIITVANYKLMSRIHLWLKLLKACGLKPEINWNIFKTDT